MQNIQVRTTQNTFIHYPVATVDGRICNAFLAGLSEFYIPQRFCYEPLNRIMAMSGIKTDSPSVRFLYPMMKDYHTRTTGTQHG